MIDSASFILNKDQFILKPDHKLDGKKTHKGRGFSIDSLFCDEYRDRLKRQGIYFPDIRQAKKTTSGNEAREGLEVTESLPKVVYGTNALEVDQNNLSEIYKKTVSYLDQIGVSTSENEIRQAILRRVDFAKIFKIVSYLGEANRAVHTLSSFDYKPRSQFNFTRFNDGGHGSSIKFWNTTQGYVIYDVIGNILTNGHTKAEQIIIDGFHSGSIKRSAIKFELSLERKDSFDALIRTQLKNSEKKKDFYLEDVMHEDLAKAILLKSFDTVFNDSAFCLVSLADLEESKLMAYLDNSCLGMNTKQKLYYWVRMATNFGINGTWEQVRLRCKGGGVDRWKREIAFVLQELGRIDGKVPNLVDFLRAEHERFEIIKPKQNLDL
jgi:hypothetical protein